MLKQPAANAKKAEGASRVVLLIPSPPNPMGRHAWVHVRLCPEMSMFTFPLNRDLRCRSKLWSLGEQKHGDDLNMYSTLGTANACQRRQ